MIQMNEDAMNSIKNGVDKIANAVKVTLGPAGKNVVLYRPPGSPVITKDGVTVARSVNNVQDMFENAAIEMMKDVASKTCDEVGDGTTTSIILAQAILSTGLKCLYEKDVNVTQLKQGIDYAVNEVVDFVNKNKLTVSSIEELYHIAFVSSNRDTDLSKLISDLFWKIGKDGVVSIEDSKTTDTYVEMFDGLKIDRGYINPYFVNNESTNECILEDCQILVTTGKIKEQSAILPVMEACLSAGKKDLLVLCDDIEPQVLSFILNNVLKKSIRMCVVKNPSFGEYRKNQLEDICTIIGSDISDIENDIISIGSADKVVVSQETTTIVGGHGDSKEIVKRLQSLRDKLNNNKLSDFQQEKIQERIAKMTNGVAVIYVGGFSEIERLEKKDRVDDAVKAVSAALKSGYVPGGGTMFAKFCGNTQYEVKKDKSFTLGVCIIEDAIKEPMKQLFINADIGDKFDDVFKTVAKSDLNIGYNIMTQSVTDLIKEGVIDPAAVTINSIKNSASIAGLLLTTDCIIVKEDIIPVMQ